MKTITIKDIAERAGVSYTQVSRALNGEYGVSAKTAELVLKVAREIGYSPNELARSLVRKRSSNIAFLGNDISNPNTAEIALAIVSTAYRLGYQTFIGNSLWDGLVQKAQFSSMLQNQVAGILISPATNDFEEILPPTVPVVSINSIISDRFSSVIVDNTGGTYRAVQHLLAGGYRRIAFAGGVETSLANKARLHGFLNALADHGAETRDGWIRHGGFSIESGYETASAFHDLAEPPDAIVCGNDMIALGVLKYARDRSICIPDTLGVIGFDNISMAALPQIDLTTIFQYSENIGEYATRLLILKIESDTDDGIEHKIIETALIQRGTTRKVP